LIVSRADSIPESISRRASAAPNTVAIVDGPVKITYAEIERQSSLLAARLQEAGAGPDLCIGIFLSRSVHFVVAALAVLKSGAAYVPMDPSTPVNRVSAILADAGATILIANARESIRLPDGPWHVIDVDDPGRTVPIAFARVETKPEDLAYVIYTSGSTGEPKGVEITHANLCNLIDWHQAAFHLTSHDRASHVASVGFDAAGWEIWPALTAGASVHIADEQTRRSAAALREWLVAEKITIGFIPTALAEQLLRTSWPADTALRVLLTGGDTLHCQPIANLPFVVVNNYGPTECTVVATSGPVLGDGESNARPSIGRPIRNAIALIVDEALEPVASGCAGELCIGGAPVGRGYRNRPELTANKFVTLSAHGVQQRIYRTGDRAALLENGEIAFLGRIDDQVKIRGYRIEPGEIVAALNACDDVEASAVVVSDVLGSGPVLVAYVVLVSGAAVTASELRDFLETRLPDYMIPALFVSIPELPMMLSGKIDKSALPPPRVDKPLSHKTSPADNAHKKNDLEDLVSALVASMLGRASIGPEENFFMVGGHSMLGAELVARIRDTFGVQLTLRQLFMSPTVAGLSKEIAELTKAAG
jgi:amino acid adenylation domain-containing protein